MELRSVICPKEEFISYQSASEKSKLKTLLRKAFASSPPT